MDARVTVKENGDFRRIYRKGARRLRRRGGLLPEETERA